MNMTDIIFFQNLIAWIAVIGVGLFLLSLIIYWLFGPTRARQFAEQEVQREMDEEKWRGGDPF